MIYGRIAKNMKIMGFVIGLLLAGISSAEPENITFKSAVIWRTDGKGDYLLPQASTGLLKSAQTISADGTIESITANWKFEGEVTLEVSANNGATFVSVVNGVPLTGGFKEGSKLAWRANISKDSSLEEVKITYTDSLGAMNTFGEPGLSGFEYRKLITVSNSGTEDLFNHQVQITVAEANSYIEDVSCGGNIEANFKDIRFTCADGETLLPYYLEKIEGAAPDRTAVFWVRVPQIPPEGVSLYIYYGNSSARDLSSADEVFDFFDDFETFDSGKWETASTGGSDFNISNSYLKIENIKIISKEYEIKDGIIEYKAKTGTKGEVWVIARGGEAYLESSGQAVYSSNYNDVEHCVAIGDIVKVNQADSITPGRVYDYRVILEGTDLTFQRYSVDYETMEAEIEYDDDGGITEGKIALKAGSNAVAYFDWIRVRRYSPAAISVAQNTAEKVSLPEFAAVEVNEKGNLILTDGYNKGNYLSMACSLPYDDVRIFVPSYTVISARDAVDVNVSMNGGGDYAADCNSGTFYYASKGDFTAGNKLKFKMNFSRKEDDTSSEIEEVTFDCRPGTITLIYPNGKEALTPSKNEFILWSASEYETAYPLTLSYSLDAGKTYKSISDLVSNTGSYLWTVPEVSSSSAVIKIADGYAPKEVYDISDTVFYISGDKEVLSEKSSEELVTEVSSEADVLISAMDLSEIIKGGKRPNTEAYDVVVKIDDPGEEATKKTSYEGEVIAVIPSGNNWSDTEKKGFLIIPVYLTGEEFQELAALEIIQSGKRDALGNPEVEMREKTNRYTLDLQKLGLGRTKIERGKRNMDDINKTLEGKYIEKGVLVE